MNKGLLGCAGVAVLVLLVLAAMGGGGYNRLVELEEGVKAAWSQVENVYQRRADLVPNLVETVRGAAEFEQETLTAVIEARSKVSQIQLQSPPTAEQLQQFDQAQSELTSALTRLMVVVEQYPELGAIGNFRDLQAQLEGTENRIAVERRRFNEAAQVFNTARRKFPTVFIANLMGFSERAYFQAAPGAQEAPKVQF